HGRRYHGGVRHLPDAGSGSSAAGPAGAHLRRVGARSGPRASRGALFRGAHYPPPACRRQVRVHPRGVRAARRLRRRSHGERRHQWRSHRRDRRGGGGVPGTPRRLVAHALARVGRGVRGAVHGDQPVRCSVGALGSERGHGRESPRARRCRGARVRARDGGGLAWCPARGTEGRGRMGSPCGGAWAAWCALMLVRAPLNGNTFFTPRVLFGLARDRLAPAALAGVNPGGTPWVAMLLVGGVAVALATTGTFERLISLAIVWI